MVMMVSTNVSPASSPSVAIVTTLGKMRRLPLLDTLVTLLWAAQGAIHTPSTMSATATETNPDFLNILDPPPAQVLIIVANDIAAKPPILKSTGGIRRGRRERRD
jgi:hypothetical protein